MRISRHDQPYSWALWTRAVERIDVPAGGPVPGPLDIDDPPPPSGPGAGAELAEGWRHWWTALVGAERPEPGRFPRAYLDFGPPDFDGLAAWPTLHGIVRRRWTQAEEWHRGRPQPDRPALVNNEVVRDVEGQLGRPVKPFTLSFLLLPVLDDEIRPLPRDRFMVSEAVYDGPSWAERLRPIVLDYGR